MPTGVMVRTPIGCSSGPGKMAVTAPGTKARPSPDTTSVGVFTKAYSTGAKPPSYVIRTTAVVGSVG
ncbi:unannotated protein [freshwater metagenome]|uniref:Unannotated protein n=1 Tax=freshwater metagenome TaxID=449393 RepID=A0A6J6F1V9_9ZZZZ